VVRLLLADQLPQHGTEDQHGVAGHPFGRGQVPDRVVGAEEVRVAVHDEEAFHCSGVLEVGLFRGWPDIDAARLRHARATRGAGRLWFSVNSSILLRTPLLPLPFARGRPRGRPGATRSRERSPRGPASGRPARGYPTGARRGAVAPPTRV